MTRLPRPRRAASFSSAGLLCAALLSACAATPDNPHRVEGGRILIVLEDGVNCWKNRCFVLNRQENELADARGRPAPLPGGLDLAAGLVTENGFRRLYEAVEGEGAWDDGAAASRLDEGGDGADGGGGRGDASGGGSGSNGTQ